MANTLTFTLFGMLIFTYAYSCDSSSTMGNNFFETVKLMRIIGTRRVGSKVTQSIDCDVLQTVVMKYFVTFSSTCRISVRSSTVERSRASLFATSVEEFAKVLGIFFYAQLGPHCRIDIFCTQPASEIVTPVRSNRVKRSDEGSYQIKINNRNIHRLKDGLEPIEEYTPASRKIKSKPFHASSSATTPVDTIEQAEATEPPDLKESNSPYYHIYIFPNVLTLIGCILLFVIILLPFFTCLVFLLMYRYTSTVIKE